jgi:Holliday junction resolvase RusA-like endonuclease
VGGYIHHYKKKNVAKAEAILRDALLPYVPEEPITDRPIYFGAIWEFPYPKSAKKHQPGKFRQKFTRPDTDNLNKMLKDEMTKAGFWKDDAQVVQEMIEKFWAEIPGIFIKVEEL